jgi:phage FluMu protein Com
MKRKFMVTYVNLRCSSCNKSLTGGYTQSYWTIGEPVITCPNCSALNSHEHSCTEWELMGFFEKAFFSYVCNAQNGLTFCCIIFCNFLGKHVV